ncbi:MAG: hypothetical protein H7X95_05795 [Deltaproteobacteria bacterium]|nr:hypothetical protein [Deltaproteobacteria bacterium]
MSKQPSPWVLALVLSFTVPFVTTSVAWAHARLDAPPGRDMRSDHKDTNGGPPCGIARTASQPSMTLTAGATVDVKWTETVNHPGCFLIDFSSAGDTNFQLLANVKHVTTGGTPRAYTKTVTLPTTPCVACTLRVRQIMLANETVACPPATIPFDASYYACGNVVLTGGDGGTVQPDAGTDVRPGTGGTTGSGGASASGGATGSGGTVATGGANASGGASSSGGSTGSGGTVTPGTGGSTVSTGGTSASGGANATGGTSATSTGGMSSATGGTGNISTAPEPACGCTVAESTSWPSIGFAMVGIAIALARRRIRSRNPHRSQSNH